MIDPARASELALGIFQGMVVGVASGIIAATFYLCRHRLWRVFALFGIDFVRLEADGGMFEAQVSRVTWLEGKPYYKYMDMYRPIDRHSYIALTKRVAEYRKTQTGGAK